MRLFTLARHLGDGSTSSPRARQLDGARPEPVEGCECQNNVLLTSEQQNIVDYLKPFISNPDYKPTLIHGVTGSGKTEVYNKLIQECIDNNKSVLLLLPEVSLSLQFERIFRKSFPV